MNSKTKLKVKWREVYSYVISSVLTIFYAVYLVMVVFGKCECLLMQDSIHFEKMLETLVTFMSIILSVFGFLIPSFLSGKGESETINYFLKYADMKLFSAKLKNVVSVGLIEIFLTSIMLLTDVIPRELLNIMILIWLWCMFFFLCNSYRFISLMISLLLTEKKKFVQEAANKISDEEVHQLHKDIKNL